MIFKLKKNKSLHLAHAESGYLCCFKTNLNPATTEANNIVPFAKKATKEVVTETVEQTAVKAGVKAGAGRVTGAVAGKVLGPVGLAYDVLGNAEPTAIGTFGTAPENTFNFASNPAETLTMALNSAGELRLKLGNVFLPGQYPLINLARDVNIGFDGETYTLYNRGETIKLALGDGIEKKGDVLEIQTGGKTIEIKMQVGYKKPDDSKTKLANGGKTATPSLEEEQQKTEKQKATDNLNKANTRTQASLGSEDNLKSRASETKINENTLARVDDTRRNVNKFVDEGNYSEALDLLEAKVNYKEINLADFNEVLAKCIMGNQAKRVLSLLDKPDLDLSDFKYLLPVCIVNNGVEEVLNLLTNSKINLVNFDYALFTLVDYGKAKKVLNLLAERKVNLSDFTYVLSNCVDHGETKEVLNLLQKEKNLNSCKELLEILVDKNLTDEVVELIKEISSFKEVIEVYEKKAREQAIIREKENFAINKLGLAGAHYYTKNLSAIAQTHRVLMRLKNQGIDLSSFVVRILDANDMDAGGLALPDFSFRDDKVILIQLNSEDIAPDSNHSRPQKSSNSSDRSIWHEFGHGLHSLMNPEQWQILSKMPLEKQREYLKEFNLTLEEVADLVSIYPTRSHHLLLEIIAEMYSAESTGRIIKDQRLWKLYDYLGGPEIPTRKTQNTQPSAQKQKD